MRNLVKFTMSNVDGCAIYMHIGCLNCPEKLHNKGLPMHIRHLLYTWYIQEVFLLRYLERHLCQLPHLSRCQTGYHPLTSTPIFVDEFLNLLSTSGVGVRANSIYIRAPMYADDLALIAESLQGLQVTLNIVHSYAGKWRHNLNANKSSIMVFGESPRSRT